MKVEISRVQGSILNVVFVWGFVYCPHGSPPVYSQLSAHTRLFEDWRLLVASTWEDGYVIEWYTIQGVVLTCSLVYFHSKYERTNKLTRLHLLCPVS